MFYRQHKTFLYHFCNLKHFLKAENSEDSLAGSCAEKYTGSSCNPVVTGLLLELGNWLAHNRGRPFFSDVRIGNVFYSWREMAKCFFYRICHPHLAKSYI